MDAQPEKLKEKKACIYLSFEQRKQLVQWRMPSRYGITIAKGSRLFDRTIVDVHFPSHVHVIVEQAPVNPVMTKALHKTRLAVRHAS